MTDELTSLLFQLLRSPATHLRLIAQTPAVWPPLLGAAGLLALAWLQDRRSSVRFRYATETYAAVFGIFTYAWFFQFGLAAARLAPAVSTFGTGSNIFISGFPDIASMFAALAGSPVRSDVLDPWELDAFVGYLGLALLALGAVAYAINQTRALALLLIPAIALAILSYGNVYELTFFQLPGFVSQRVTTRFLVLTILWLTFAVAVTVNYWWRSERKNPLIPLLTVGGAAGLALQLLLRVHTWRPHAEAALPNPEVLKAQAVETPYLCAIWLGVAISAVTTVLLVRAWRRDSRG